MCTGDLLAEFGYDVVALAEDGRQLVEKTLATRPDVVVTDIKMPRLTGVEAAHEILQHMDVPFVFITGYRREDYPVPNGCVHVYLTKPVDSDGLKAGIEEALCLFRARHDHTSPDLRQGYRAGLAESQEIP